MLCEKEGLCNFGWWYFFNCDVFLMLDVWEYLWYVVWDSVFYMVLFVKLDFDFVKD